MNKQLRNFILILASIFIFTSCFTFTPRKPNIISKNDKVLEITNISYGLTEDKVLVTFKNHSSDTITLDDKFSKIIYNGIAFNIDIISSYGSFLTIPPNEHVEFQFKSKSINDITKKFHLFLVYKQMNSTKTSNYSIYLN